MSNRPTTWVVEFADEFEPEFDALSVAVQDELLAQAKVVEQFGPEAKRPRVDTLKGSKHANMKEIRFDADDCVWRVAFAFDPRRKAILLVAGDKSGGSEKRFYKQLIALSASSRITRSMPTTLLKGRKLNKPSNGFDANRLVSLFLIGQYGLSCCLISGR